MGKVIEDCSLAEVIGQLKEGHKARREYEDLLLTGINSREFEGMNFTMAAEKILRRLSRQRSISISILFHEMIRGGMWWDHSINSIELSLMERPDLFKSSSDGWELI